MTPTPPAAITDLRIDELVESYDRYLRARMEFLLERFRKFPRFRGVQTGYDSITGEEFSPEHLASYSWINGRGACVFARFAGHFPDRRQELLRCAAHAIEALETHYALSGGRFPFMADADGKEMDVGCSCPPGHCSYSDLYAGFGFLEYGGRTGDSGRAETAAHIFRRVRTALWAGQFVTEPEPTPTDRILENPYSIALDLANEFVKQLGDKSYLEEAARFVTHLLDRYYLGDLGAYIQYVTLEGKPFRDEMGRYVVDAGHAIEFASFALEFSRLAEEADRYAELRSRINAVAPDLLLWNIDRGWNREHGGIYKTVSAESGEPINDTMPWWILPEGLLALMLAYERTGEDIFLQNFKKVHNAYFGMYMSEKTSYGPFQNLDGKTGRPIRIVPACKFQDPEFHSGKNLLTITEVFHRILRQRDARSQEV